MTLLDSISELINLPLDGKFEPLIINETVLLKDLFDNYSEMELRFHDVVKFDLNYSITNNAPARPAELFHFEAVGQGDARNIKLDMQ